MIAPSLRLAIAVVRAWTRVYTSGMPSAIRDARRAEIESDLWECQRDVHGGRVLGLSWHVLARVVIGVPDDLGWRIEHTTSRRRTVAVTAGFAGICVALWFMVASRSPQMPQLPAAPDLRARAVKTAPPPPPPPPPPCRPPGFGTPTDECTR